MTNKKLEFKIGNVNGNPKAESKFIIVSEEKSLILYSKNLEEICGEKPYHSQIVESYGLNPKEVVGGGRFRVYENTLRIYDYSSTFGAVPKAVAKEFGKVLSNYLKECSISKILAETSEYYLTGDQEKIWNNLGFKLK